MDAEASESSDHSHLLLDVLVRKGKKIFLKMKNNPLILLAMQFFGKTEKGEQENHG